MVRSCAEMGTALSCGSISTTHPSFSAARVLLRDGAIGELTSLEAPGPGAQHQNWSTFLDVMPDWVVGVDDAERRESGSDEFTGTGMAWSAQARVGVHFRRGAPGVRLSGTQGEMTFEFASGWRLWQQAETAAGMAKVEVPWPDPQFQAPYGAVYTIADVIDSIEGRMPEPNNSGRRVAIALETEIALKQSARRHERVQLPLADRNLGLRYDWFR